MARGEDRRRDSRIVADLLSIEDVAALCEVGTATVRGWIGGRTPYLPARGALRNVPREARRLAPLPSITIRTATGRVLAVRIWRPDLVAWVARAQRGRRLGEA